MRYTSCLKFVIGTEVPSEVVGKSNTSIVLWLSETNHVMATDPKDLCFVFQTWSLQILNNILASGRLTVKF